MELHKQSMNKAILITKKGNDRNYTKYKTLIGGAPS